MDNYTDILKNSYAKHRDDLYDKIDQILFGLKENEDVIYGVLCNSRMDEFNSDYISAPTIAEVVMWLYEKYGVWIVVNITISSDWYFELYDLNSKRNAEIKVNVNLYSSPSEAYESAIKHYLTQIIKP